MDTRDLGDFWKVQAQLAQTLQLDIARTLNAKRLHGERGAKTMTQAAIAKRLATIAQEHGDNRIPALGAALIRAGKAGATEKTLTNAIGISPIGTRKLLNVLESGGFAMQWTDDVWRIDTVHILAREERAALEALHAATAHEREAAAGAVAQRKENAPQAQTGGDMGERKCDG